MAFIGSGHEAPCKVYTVMVNGVCIRAVIIFNGEIYFVLVDLAKYLGYRDSYNLVRDLDDKSVVLKKPIPDSNGKMQLMNCIPEKALNEICIKLRTKRPEVEQFKNYILNVVYNIRSHLLIKIPGTIQWHRVNPYQPIQTINSQVDMLILENKEIKNKYYLQLIYNKLAERIHQLEMSNGSMMTHSVENVPSYLITIEEMAKYIWDNNDPDNVFKLSFYLRWDGYLVRQIKKFDIPSEDAIECGLMVISEDDFTTYITPKGQLRFTKLYKGKS